MKSAKSIVRRIKNVDSNKGPRLNHKPELPWSLKSDIAVNTPQIGWIGHSQSTVLGQVGDRDLLVRCAAPGVLCQSRRWGRRFDFLFENKAPTDRARHRPSPMKDPHIPDGHPIDTDGKPLGHVIPDYDVELPARSWGGYTRDYKAWEEKPPEFPPTDFRKTVMYDYHEMIVRDTPPVVEVNVALLVNVLAVFCAAVSIFGTKRAVNRYYSRYGGYYESGWPCFHYNPNYDIVPLTKRPDGLPPEFPMFDARDTHALEFLADGMKEKDIKEERRRLKKAARAAAKAAKTQEEEVAEDDEGDDVSDADD